MTIAADIIVKDDGVSPAAIVGAVVGVFDHVSYALVASAVTDGAGRATFLLPGSADPGTTYEVRIFKLGVVFKNPFRIKVIDPLGGGQSNIFDVAGTLTILEAATDPRCCRCTGRFLDFSNRPVRDKLVRISAKTEFQTPKVVDGNMIAPDSMELRTDASGFVRVDLVRTGVYYVFFAGDEDEVLEIIIPDRSSVNLVELIHPQPVSLDWDDSAAPGNVVSLAVGETKTIPLSVLFSDFEDRTLDLGRWIILTMDPGDKLSAELTNAGLVISGLETGAIAITATARAGLQPPRIPTYSLSAPTLTVNVT